LSSRNRHFRRKRKNIEEKLFESELRSNLVAQKLYDAAIKLYRKRKPDYVR
jgi:hypothetical protein